MRAVSWARLVGTLLLVLVPGRAGAATVRRFFEPTDLETEKPLHVELDTQWGLVRGQDAFRVSVPDFELDVGILEHLELDFDGELAVGGPDTGEFRFDEPAQDNLWTSVKYIPPISDVLGIQVGPIWPIAPGAQGVGVEGLLLLEFKEWLFHHNATFVLNAGGFTEPGDASGLPKNPPRPADTAGDRRATGIASGVDIDAPINCDCSVSLLGEVSGVAYVTDDPPEIATSLGIERKHALLHFGASIDLSVTGFRGWRKGGDQYGVLLGASLHWPPERTPTCDDDA